MGAASNPSSSMAWKVVVTWIGLQQTSQSST